MTVTLDRIRKAIAESLTYDLEECIAEATDAEKALFRTPLHGAGSGDALIQAVMHWPVTRHSVRIITLLLRARDKNNLPLVNINAVDGQGRTALHHLLDNPRLSHGDKFTCFELMTDLRDTRGNLLIDMTACRWTHGTPLMDAIRINHLDIVRALLDLRKSNGTYAVDINEARSQPYHTALDVAYMHCHDNEVGRAIENALFRRGAQRYRDLHPKYIKRYYSLGVGHQLHPDFDPKPNNFLVSRMNPLSREEILSIEAQVGPQASSRPSVPPVNAMLAFVANDQNTHDSKVTLSGNASYLRLKKRYPNVNLHSSRMLEEIEQYFKTAKPEAERAYALTRLQAIKSDPTLRSEINMTLKEQIALVWVAIHDKTAVMPGRLEVMLAEIENRKQALFHNMYLAQIEYSRVARGGVNACFRGTSDKILESIDRTHPDVIIMTAEDQSAIQRLAIMRTIAIVRETVKALPPQERKIILTNWDKETKDPTVTAFRAMLASKVDALLQDEYATFLPFQNRKGIVSELPNMAKPFVDNDLHTLADYISDLDTLHGSKLGRNATTRLKLEVAKLRASHSGDEETNALELARLRDVKLCWELKLRLGDGRDGNKLLAKEVLFSASDLEKLDQMSSPIAKLNALEELYSAMVEKDNHAYTRKDDKTVLFFLEKKENPVSATFVTHLTLFKAKYIEILEANIRDERYKKGLVELAAKSLLIDENKSNYISFVRKATKSRERVTNIIQTAAGRQLRK